MANLHELTVDYRNLAEQLEGMDDKVFRDTLESSMELMAIEDKVLNTVKFIQNVEGDLPAIESEIDRLTNRKKAIKNKIASVKDYLQNNLEGVGLEKIKVGTYTCSLQNSPPALLVADEKAIPSKYLTVIPEHTEINKADLKADLKKGIEVAGCSLSVGKSLRIR